MELPEHYLPVRLCPHIGEGERYRLMFAECGSYENMSLSISDEGENVTFLPQKGQGSVKNLSMNIPSLPLFNCPLNDEWKEWDHILGMKNYNEMQNDLKPLANIMKAKRSLIKNAPKSESAKKLHACYEIIKDKDTSGLTELPANQCSEFLQMFDKGIHKMHTAYQKAANVCAHSTSCLKGYNKDFYGGLLSVLPADNCKSSDILIHAGGSSFQDIFMTEAFCKHSSRLKHARLLDKLTLDEPVYQIISSNMCTDDEGLICAREKHKCVLIGSNLDHKLVQKDLVDIPHEVLSSVSFSPYMSNEILVSADTGAVYLWDINSGSTNRLLVKTQDPDSRDRWSFSYFGGHPRHVVVADSKSVAMFDHRSHFSDGMGLFHLSPNLTKMEECVGAVTSLGFPFHAVVTDYAVFIIDQRFRLTPVLKWSTEFLSCPQYIQVLHQQSSQLEKEKILFVASQQPSEVMCFPMTIQSECSPRSPILPWKISQIGDFSRSIHTSNNTCDMMTVERRFEVSLAGIAVSDQSTQKGFTVYQVDGYGDVFYQSLFHNQGDPYNLQSCSEGERQAADQHAENWIKSFESSASPAATKLQCLSVNLAPSIWNDIFSQSPSNTIIEQTSDSSVSHKQLHRCLKGLEKLPCNGSSARLYLALKEKKDVMEFLQKREDDHMAMKQKIRKVNLRLLNNDKKRPRKCFKKTTKRRRISQFYCESFSSDSNDDIDSGQSTSKKIIKSSSIQDSSD